MDDVLWALIEPLPPTLAGTVAGASAGCGPLCLQGIPYVLRNDITT